MNKLIFSNLKIQLLCAVIISVLAGTAFFGVSFFTGDLLLNKTVYGHSFAEKMAGVYFSKLQDYVEKECVSINNLQRLNAWCSRGEKVYLTIYLDNKLVYESHVFVNRNGEDKTSELDSSLEDPDNEYILTLYDGVQAQAFLYYYAGDAFYYSIIILCAIASFAVCSFCFITLINRKVLYISTLKQELDILSTGQLEYPITITGNDELGKLASGIDQMRQSIIRHQELENQMRTANSELITAMSHDLRTPLTSLLAYLEIVERKKYSSENQMNDLIHKSIGQTMRIRRMADKLFEYFLAYSTEWDPLSMEQIDADQFLCQIIEDYVYALESKGMNIKVAFYPTDAKIKVNAELFQRAMDNLYSNLIKYANPKEVIWISCKQKENQVLISISNEIGENIKKKESTSIGLITCRRILEYHKGEFSSYEDGNKFYVTVSLPICE